MGKREVRTSAVDLSVLGYPLLSFVRLCRNDTSIFNICSCKGCCLAIFVRQREFDGSSLQIRKYFVIFRPSKQTGNVSRILLLLLASRFAAVSCYCTAAVVVAAAVAVVVRPFDSRFAYK